jgi:glycosyltransferase involved in cell wall biosynthesis
VVVPLSCSVLVNSYNYARYVCEAIDSVLAQTLPPLEIIVVDDGSTDNTQEVLRERYGKNPIVKVIHQRNGGQGLAVVAALTQAEGDLIFLLDADDKYEPDHLEKVAAAYAADKYIDYVFTAHRAFGVQNEVIQAYPQDKHLGVSVVGAMTRLMYVGAICSCITLRRNLALTLLPAMQRVAPRWKIAADDLFNYGSSIAGARKLYLAAPTVLYRMHEVNHSYKTTTVLVNAHHLLRSNLVAVYCDHLGVRPEIANRADIEFHSIEAPTLEQYKVYRSIAWGLKLPLLERLKMHIRMRMYFQGREDTSLRSLGGAGKAS